METLTRINGNGQPYTMDLPKIVILAENINDTALDFIWRNTHLNFVKKGQGYEAQPTGTKQMALLMVGYNFKSRYYNNNDSRNTLYLKLDHHVGFDVDSICVDCCKANNVPVGDLQPGDRLAC